VRATYLWDEASRSVDLTKARLTLDRTALTFPNCLDYIQVTGAEILSTRGPALTRPKSTRGESTHHISSRCQEESTSYTGGKRPEVVAGVESWASCSRRCSLKASCKSWTWGRRSGPPGQALQCTLLQGHVSSTPDSYSVSGARDCLPRPYSPAISVGGATTLPARLPGRPASPSYSSVAGGSTGGTRSPTSTQRHFSNQLPRARKGAARTVGPIKLSPPYLGSTIDVIVPVQDCAGYMFHLQIHGGSKKLGELGSIPLAALADLPGYVPPPLTSVITVAWSPSGTPVYSTTPSSGVPSSCIPAYLEAVDAYTHRVDQEVSWLEKEERRVGGLTSSTGAILDTAQEELLKATGCTCTSPHLQLATTDAAVLKKDEAKQLGKYSFGGMHAGHPYYKRDLATSTTTTKEEPVFLYYIPNKKQWVFGAGLGDTRGLFFGTQEKSPAKCPGDSSSRGTWQTATATFGRWKVNNKVTVACQTKL